MKQISKLMLAAVASVALAAPAFAWDFGASGSNTASYNITSTKASKDAVNTISSGGVSSSASSLALSSSHTDGTKTLSLSYTLDWDGNLDETISLSGSSTVGGWTASGDIAYNRDSVGCSNAASSTTDNITSAAATCGTVGVHGEEDSAAVTLTDGTMTIKLGDASHLANQNVSSGGAAAGAVSFDTADDEISVGAFVGSFNGVSLGYAISDTMSVTVALQASGDQNDLCGAQEFQDSDANAGTSGTGASFSGTFGTIGVGATFCSASTKDAGTSSAAGGSTSTSSSTMGVGISMDFGDLDPFISFGTYSAVGATTLKGTAGVGNEVGLTYALGNDSVVLYYGSVSEIDTAATTGVAGEPITVTGMELGYNTTLGPASLQVGYGTQSKAQTGGTVDGFSMTDIEVAMTYSF
jgi:hypothetical protein